MAALDVDVLRNRLRACINAILQELNSPNFDSDSHDSVFFRGESLYIELHTASARLLELSAQLLLHVLQQSFSLVIVVDPNM